MAQFGSIFPIFWGKKKFSWKIRLCHGFLAPCQNLEKVNDTIQRKCPDRRKDGRMTEGQKDRQTLFYRTSSTAAGCPKKSFTSEERRATLLKTRLQFRCFPVNFPRFFKTPFFTEHLQGCLCWKFSLLLVHSQYFIKIFCKKINSI